MSKIKNPIRFSDHFGFDSRLMDAVDVLNPTLAVDTKLFIDPLLLEKSQHPEMRDDARALYESHFANVIKLLQASKTINDTYWRNALRLLSFPEIKWTCLGYGSQSISGSGSGNDTTHHLTVTAKEIVNLGVDDPDLFAAMALFEEGIGPDRISDMTANVIFESLLKFNDRVLKKLPVPLENFSLTLRNGKSYNAQLPQNPLIDGKQPIILVPRDILRDLPIASDWSDVAASAARNAALRSRVNDDIAKLWARKTRKDKDELRRWAMSGKGPFTTLLEMVRGANPTAYDMTNDPLGEILWRNLAATVATQHPFNLTRPSLLDLNGVASVVEQIIEQFRFLIEKRRLSEELYNAGKPRPEKSAQRLFFAIAYAYCKANNIDITPEADTGNGPVDFKLSNGFSGRVLVEIKLSTNGKLVKGYSRQLETYKTAEETIKGYYVVLDVGQMGTKGKSLMETKNEAVSKGEKTSEIVFIDGTRQPSASKL